MYYGYKLPRRRRKIESTILSLWYKSKSNWVEECLLNQPTLQGIVDAGEQDEHPATRCLMDPHLIHIAIKRPEKLVYII